MLNRRLAVLALGLCVAGLALVVSGQEQKAKPAAKTIKLTGCVMPGKEAGCLIIKKGMEYSLHFPPGNEPKPGTAVSLEGTLMDADTCMQGTPVNVTKWTATKASCPKPAPQ
jgi:hypothetical protein